MQEKQASTRNMGLSKKHMTTTTSPVFERAVSDQSKLVKQSSMSTAKKNKGAVFT
jgi:hypothetical protein